MPTALQLKKIHIAARQAGLSDELYRMVLRNVGRVESAKLLNNAQFEDVMAVIEDAGFREPGKSESYWRDKVATRGGWANERMQFKIRELAAQTKYGLTGLCKRFSGGKATSPTGLRPYQAQQLIEGLKAIIARDGEVGGMVGQESPGAMREDATDLRQGGQDGQTGAVAAAESITAPQGHQTPARGLADEVITTGGTP